MRTIRGRGGDSGKTSNRSNKEGRSIIRRIRLRMRRMIRRGIFRI